MKRINLLDCTLRDGAYIVEAKFGTPTIRGLISELQKANIEMIECGWLKDSQYCEGTTFYHTPEDIKPFLADKDKRKIYMAMIDWNRYDLDQLPENDGKSIDAIRVVFPKEHYKEAAPLAKIIKEKGYRVFFQAANTLGYTDETLIDMIKTMNETEPEALSIVDTFGAMYESDLRRIVTIVDHNLDKNIKLGLHSHNNLQQSFALARYFIELFHGSDREIIVDSSLVGMGRGAGNVPTELLVEYINRFDHGYYDLDRVLDAIDLYMTQFIGQYEWGYSIPYFLAGKYCTHVNNISYLKKSHRTQNKDIKYILESMPAEKRIVYDYDLLEEKYVEVKNRAVDDDTVIGRLEDAVKEKEILVIAPGKNAGDNTSDRYRKLKTDSNVVKIGVNGIIPDCQYDYLFFSNEMRFKYALEAHSEYLKSVPIIVTSNVETNMAGERDVSVINYDRLVKRGWIHFDNSVIMCMRLLVQLQVKNIYLAGFDGYSAKSDYAENVLKTDMDMEEINILNKEIADMFADFCRSYQEIKIEFVTESKYK